MERSNFVASILTSKFALQTDQSVKLNSSPKLTFWGTAICSQTWISSAYRETA